MNSRKKYVNLQERGLKAHMANIFRDLFDIATGADVGKITDTLASLNDTKRIRSISSMSSRSIFYFPMFVSDDHSSEEIDMMQKYAEANYAVMLAECFAQVPAIKVRPNDMNQISKFLDQFHQNVGSSRSGSGEAARKFIAAVSSANTNVRNLRGLFENACNVIEEQFNTYKAVDQKEVKHLDESYTSLNEMFNLSPLDPLAEASYQKALKRKEELSTWGFIGESVPDDMFSYDMASEQEDIPETNPVTPVTAEDDSAAANAVNEATTKEAYSKLAAKLDSIPNNKIKSAKNRAALRKMETKLNSMKKKYTKYLVRYKKKYEGNDDSKKKLTIRFEGMAIDDPKSFMKVYGEFIKVVNKKLALVKKRQEEISKKTAKSVVETGTSPAWLDAPLESCSLTDLDEMSMNILDYVEYEVNQITEATDAEAFGYIDLIDEANSPSSASTSNTSRSRSMKYEPMVNTGKMFTDLDVKKANDALPTIIMVNIKMVVEGSDQITDYSFPVGVKVNVHQVPWKEMSSSLASSLVQGRKLLSFIKLTSGEEGSLADLLFGIGKLKKEVEGATSGKSYQIYRSAIQRRKRLSKMSIPFITKKYTMNASLMISQNVASQIKDIVGIDVNEPKALQKVMMEEYVFAVYLTDANGEVCRVFYDNDVGFNEVSYKMLQRQQRNNEMQMKDLLRILGSTQR